MTGQGKKFFFIGLGMEEPSSLSKDVIDVLSCVDTIYFEIYTNFMSSTLEDYELFLNKKITPIYRNSLETDSRKFLLDQKNSNSALIISGDPFIATTHYMLLVEAVQLGLTVEIYNNISIYSLAPSITGLSAYKFGKTVTIAFPERIKSEGPYDAIKANKDIDAHSLVLLDVDLVQNKFLPINRALSLLLDIEASRKEQVFNLDQKIIALNKLGTSEAIIRYATIEQLLAIDWDQFGAPQALIIPGKLSAPEQEILEAMWSKEQSLIQPRSKKAKIVVTGTFDIIHPGHLEFFEHAKKLSIPSELWVIVARNSSVSDFKKKGPILDENIRVKILNSLKPVDYALLGNEGPDKIKIIEELRPDIIALGYDQWINEDKLRDELVKRGLPNTKVYRLPKFGSNGYSSSTEIRQRIIQSHKHTDY